jgi:aldehyde dehydrogenase (NAD+)
MLVQGDLFIGGHWVAPEYSGWLDVISPITEDVIGRVPEATPADIDKAVTLARKAFDSGPWPRMSIDDRAEVVLRLAELLKPRIDELTHLQIDEMGSPFRFMGAMTEDAIRNGIQIEVDLARNIELREFRETPSGKAVLLREPVGVVVAIIPWNGPVNLILGKLIPAVMAGCSIIIKPAPETPLDANIVAEAIGAAGFPEGVVSIIPGGRELGEYLVSHPGVDKVSFTGSTAAGRRIGSICGDQIKRVTLELGGKSAGIVLADADLERDVPNMINGAMQNNGQVCAAITRIVVPRSRYDELIERFIDKVSAMKVGDPHDPGTDFGPLVAERQRRSVEDHIHSGIAEGAKLLFGGGRPKAIGTGWYVEPTIFGEVDNSMRIAQEEIFGPVVSVIPYETEEEGVRIANDSKYGLSGAVFTTNPQNGLAIAEQIRTGTFSINKFRHARDLPFGGYKQSGIGREHGMEGLESYLERKVVYLPRQ